MGNSIDPKRSVASVLIVAADSVIQSLVSELVAFAGHRPLFDVTGGAAGDSIRRARPDITLLDTSLPASVVRACLAAADESASRVILISSAASDMELRNEALAEGRLYFPFPGGPRPLARVIARALAQKPVSRVTPLPERLQSAQQGSVHPAICAALASAARARSLAARVDSRREANAALHDEMRSALAETRRSRSALRAAVTDYAKQLKEAALPIDAVLQSVYDAMVDCAAVVGAESSVAMLLAESEDWTRTAFAGS